MTTEAKLYIGQIPEEPKNPCLECGMFIVGKKRCRTWASPEYYCGALREYNAAMQVYQPFVSSLHPVTAEEICKIVTNWILSRDRETNVGEYLIQKLQERKQ